MHRKNFSFLIIGLTIGMLISGIGVYATTILSSSEVSYDNSKSNSLSNNVQGSIEELYKKSSNCTTGSCSLTQSNFYVGYTYNQTSGASNYCVTGDEATCTRTDCYTSSNKTCPAGTIIDYIVSGTNTRVRFHVIKDKGKTMTMQSQKNTIYNLAWDSSGVNTKGPTTILPQLEKATSSWTNVEDQTYTMGETVFKDNAFTGCSSYNSCTENKYTLGSKTVKARMITVQEANTFGCTTSNSSCPIWMYNYTYGAMSYGGTVDDNIERTMHNYGYWTMSSYQLDTIHAWYIAKNGHIYANYSTGTNLLLYGARAVIEVSK